MNFRLLLLQKEKKGLSERFIEAEGKEKGKELIASLSRYTRLLPLSRKKRKMWREKKEKTAVAFRPRPRKNRKPSFISALGKKRKGGSSSFRRKSEMGEGKRELSRHLKRRFWLSRKKEGRAALRRGRRGKKKTRPRDAQRRSAGRRHEPSISPSEKKGARSADRQACSAGRKKGRGSVSSKQ